MDRNPQIAGNRVNNLLVNSGGGPTLRIVRFLMRKRIELKKEPRYKDRCKEVMV